jgi:hypothetical protein
MLKVAIFNGPASREKTIVARPEYHTASISSGRRRFEDEAYPSVMILTILTILKIAGLPIACTFVLTNLEERSAATGWRGFSREAVGEIEIVCSTKQELLVRP